MSTLTQVFENINSAPGYPYLIARTLIVYFYAIPLFRLGNRRSQFTTAFDYTLVIIIGAVLSRCINGSSTLLESIVSSFILIILHWVLALGAFHSSRFGKIVKGAPVMLMKDGKINWHTMRKNQITREDLAETCRVQLNENNLDNIKEAHLERTGKISFVKHQAP